MNQIKKFGIFLTGIGLVISFILMLTITGAQAQNRAQKSIIAQLLWQSLLQCYSAPEVRLDVEDEVVLGVWLTTRGDIGNLPEILSPTVLSQGERALLRQSTLALIDCTPIISGNGDKTIYGEFDIVATRDGIMITNVDAYVGRAEVQVTLDSLTVVEQPSATTETAETPELVDLPAAQPAPATSTTETQTAPAIEMTEITSPTPANMGVGTQTSESEMNLTRDERREIQRRLTLLDYNTKGVDGVFGPGSRAAIRSWQTDNGIPMSGYFNVNQLVKLNEMSQAAYEKWEARPKRYYGSDGCLREPNGRIIQNRSFKCDLKAASQNLGLSN